MVLDLEKYKVTDGKTPLSAEELNARLYAIVRRLHALEELRVDWEASISEVRNYGLTRINDAVAPLLENLRQQMEGSLVDMEALLAELQAERTAMETALARAEAHLVLIGDGPPADGLGADDNYYIDRQSGRFYHKSSGGWAYVGRLTSAQDPRTVSYVSSTLLSQPGNHATDYATGQSVVLSQTASGVGYVVSAAYDAANARTVVTVEGITVDAGLTACVLGLAPQYAPKTTGGVSLYQLDHLD